MRIRLNRVVLGVAAALLLVFGVARAQFAPYGYGANNVCSFYPNYAKLTVPISSATSATNLLVAQSGTNRIYVCEMVVIPASSSAITLGYSTGAGTACASPQATTALTGAMTAQVTQGSVNAALVTAAGANLCYTTTASGATGYVTYVQAP